MKNSTYVVILAGGSGTRFWPLSREGNPKQFLKLLDKYSLFQKTLERVKPLVPPGNILIVANQRYSKVIQEQSKIFKIPSQNILLESVGRNTAPAIAWAAARIAAKDKEGIMVVLPSDHLVLNPVKFLKLLREAVGLAKHGYLMTLGIVPSRPETGYGYVKARPEKMNGQTIWRVVKFTEKPSLSKAKEFVRSKKYLWNSGMFIWRCDVILGEFEKYLPAVYRYFSKPRSDQSVRAIWKDLPSISIDYGILEKARNVLTIPAKDIRWSDLGSWEALAEILLTEKNVLQGQVLETGCTGTLVKGNKKLIAVVGLNDVIVVDTDDALLVCRKDQSQHVKEIVQGLKTRQLTKFL